MSIRQFPGRVLANELCGPRCRKLRIAPPARAIRYAPGQFFHIRCGRGTDPLLRRPFSVYAAEADADGWIRRLEFLFTVVGHGTRALASHAPGDDLDLLGPLGQGFQPPPDPARHVMVAGGVGVAPFYDLAEHLLKRGRSGLPPAMSGPGGSPHADDRGRETPPTRVRARSPFFDDPHAPRITLLFGARTRDELYALHDLEALGIDIRTSTDDGTHGRKGFVTEMLEELLDAEAGGRGLPPPTPEGRGQKPAPTRVLQVYGCGPAPMLDRVVRIVTERGVPCQLSLDRRMGCGLGACGACVCKVKSERDPEGWNYIRICKRGPVVDAHRLVLG